MVLLLCRSEPHQSTIKADCGHAHYAIFTEYVENCDLLQEAGPNACFGYRVAKADFRKRWATKCIVDCAS
jgi:hypothetical protein